MALDNGLSDGRPETGAFWIVETGGWHSGELIKYGFENFLRNSLSLVFDRYFYKCGIFFNSYCTILFLD